MSPALKTRSPRTEGVYQTVDVIDLSGGLDLRRSPTLLAPNRARVLKNFSLTVPGELSFRAGYTRYTTTTLGSSRGQGGQRIYLASTTFLLVAWGGNIYRPPDSAVQSSVVEFSSRSEGNEIYFPYDRTMVAAFDAANRPVKST